MNDLEILNHHQLSNPTPVSLHFKTSETGAEEGRGGWGESAEGKGPEKREPLSFSPQSPPFSFLPCSLCPFDASHSGYFKIKRTKAHTTFQRPKRPDLSRFPQHGGVLLLPPEWDSSPSHTHLNNWVKRDKVEWCSLSKETTRRARLEPQTSRSGVWGVNRSPSHTCLHLHFTPFKPNNA